MINRDRINIPIPGSLTSQECQLHLLGIIRDITSGNANLIKQGKDRISDVYYRGRKIKQPDGSTKQEVVEALGNLYQWKCAFCESKRFIPQIEHFRPTRSVTGNNPSNMGYFWLCYEWTNLLPVCSECNKEKLNSFPILTNPRVVSPKFLLSGDLDTNANIYTERPLINEDPELLHPEYDDHVQTCFSFDSKGKIKGIDPQGRGKKTIEEIGLDNKDLNFFRQKEIDICEYIIRMAILYDE